MTNGRSIGIKVENPLPNPVLVEVINGEPSTRTGAPLTLRRRFVGAHDLAFIPLAKRGPYEVRTTILKQGVSGLMGVDSDSMIGVGSWERVDHDDVPVKSRRAKGPRKTGKPPAEVEIRSLADMFRDKEKEEALAK
jgi:hypothetical protein